jgi:glycosyltransferase involved in cell wall biosynthesis
MKILWMSNAPWVGTGYGQQCALWTPRINELHPTAIAANFGLHGGRLSWQGMTVYPAGYDGWSNDIIPSHAADWLDGEPGDGWLLTLMDVWVFKNPRFQRQNVASWCPIDHLPAPPLVVQWFKQSGAVPIAMSRFGERLLRSEGLDPLYVPHGVDTDVYRPGHQQDAREKFGLPADAFVVTMNAANKGRAVDRKSFGQAFQAFSVLAAKRDDAVLYLHTDMSGQSEGRDLYQLAAACRIPEDRLFYVDQYAYRAGIPSNVVAQMYQASDVLLAPSMGEGFGIPVIEAQACGVPVIVSDFSAQPELAAPRLGWAVEGQPHWDIGQGAWLHDPYVEAVITALEDAYERRLYGHPRLREFVVDNYGADAVWDNHWLPVLGKLERRLPKVRRIAAKPVKVAA